MDPASIAAMAVSSQSGLTQQAMATQMERMKLQDGAAVVKLIDAAQQNFSSLANVGAGVGTQLNVSA